MRQAAHHQHEAGCAEHYRFLQRTAVVVARRLAVRPVRHHHAAAAIAGELEPGVAQRLGGAIDSHACHVMTPGTQRRNPLAGADLDDRHEITLPVEGDGVDRHPAMIAREVPDCATLLELEVCRSDEASLWTMSLRQDDSIG